MSVVNAMPLRMNGQTVVLRIEDSGEELTWTCARGEIVELSNAIFERRRVVVTLFEGSVVGISMLDGNAG